MTRHVITLNMLVLQHFERVLYPSGADSSALGHPRGSFSLGGDEGPRRIPSRTV